MKDRFDYELNVGDRVAFGTKQQYDHLGENLRSGTVTGTDTNNRGDTLAVIVTDTFRNMNRQTTVYRLPNNVIKLD